MHDQLRRNSNRIFKEKEEIKKVGEERVSVAWNPSFLPEDFLEEDGRDSPAAAAGGPSKRKEEEKKEEGEEGTGLDLKLSLYFDGYGILESTECIETASLASRCTKQMHDQLRRNSNRIFKEKEEIKKIGEERVSVAWNPSFLPEDFLEEDGRDSPAAAAGGPSKRKEEEKKEEGEEGTGLDLKLSL
ncbi:hypothetical protein DKX38_006845 [Salix brachista]|uniref:Uncharacterized protein n=1 Tax=Salix brachista TaxID=2182728 RepID=A0A5N5MP20_9ROSI|nr:hypothetical protein DKX38_006845 [Salix brachista]